MIKFILLGIGLLASAILAFYIEAKHAEEDEAYERELEKKVIILNEELIKKIES